MKALLGCRPVFRFVRFLAVQFLRLKFNYRSERIEPEQKPFIVLSNHNTDYDPLMLGTSFSELIHYVASDHIFRLGFLSRVLIFLAEPIPRLKSSTDVQTVKQLLKKLRQGCSVGIFAEGNRSFSGETGNIPESTGKLVKLSGTPLITYRIDGGYFTNPRWGRKCRKGSMTGRMVHFYSLEEIGRMSADELNEAIQRDLYVNAFEEAENNLIPYRGKDPAENLELALYTCPVCRGMETLKSSGDRFCCACGLQLRYTPYGFFEPIGASPLPHRTVLDWYRWQSGEIAERLREYYARNTDEPIFSDHRQTLWQVDKATHAAFHGTGTLKLYRDRLALVQEDGQIHTFPLEDMTDMSIHGPTTLIFSTTDGLTYEIRTGTLRSGVKYLDGFHTLKTLSAPFQ